MCPDANETKKIEEEQGEKEYVYTYVFFCAEGIDPADQLDQNFHDIHTNGEVIADYGELVQAECICTSEDTGKTPPQISVDDLKEFLEGIDQRAADDDDEETPPEYAEGIFSTTNEIRRKYGIPLSNN
jgi:hypothetical protein